MRFYDAIDEVKIERSAHLENVEKNVCHDARLMLGAMLPVMQSYGELVMVMPCIS